MTDLSQAPTASLIYDIATFSTACDLARYGIAQMPDSNRVDHARACERELNMRIPPRSTAIE